MDRLDMVLIGLAMGLGIVAVVLSSIALFN